MVSAAYLAAKRVEVQVLSPCHEGLALKQPEHGPCDDMLLDCCVDHRSVTLSKRAGIHRTILARDFLSAQDGWGVPKSCNHDAVWAACDCRMQVRDAE